MLAESQFSVHFPVKDRVADVDLSVVTVDEAIVAAREGFALLHTSTVPTRQVGSDASSLRRRDDSAPTWNSRRGGGGGASAPGVGRASNEIRIGGSRLHSRYRRTRTLPRSLSPFGSSTRMLSLPALDRSIGAS